MKVKIKNKTEQRLENWKKKAVERGQALRAEKKRSCSLILSRTQHKELSLIHISEPTRPY